MVILNLTFLDLLVAHAEILAGEPFLEQTHCAPPVGAFFKAVDLVAHHLFIFIESIVLLFGKVVEMLVNGQHHTALVKPVTFLDLAAHIVKHLNHPGFLIRCTFENLINNYLFSRCQFLAGTLLVDSNCNVINVPVLLPCIQACLAQEVLGTESPGKFGFKKHDSVTPYHGTVHHHIAPGITRMVKEFIRHYFTRRIVCNDVPLVVVSLLYIIVKRQGRSRCYPVVHKEQEF